jgi:glycosyltransferase involved in cell wall biosynthesis
MSRYAPSGGIGNHGLSIVNADSNILCRFGDIVRKEGYRPGPLTAIKYLLVDQSNIIASQMHQLIKERRSGPDAVSVNLIAGLSKLGVNFNLNPTPLAIKGRVGLLSNIDALTHAIKLKRFGKINQLVVGPNMVIDPRDYDSILLSEEIDVVITPCKWTANYYAKVAPEIKRKIREWASGVDTDYWAPCDGNRGQSILVYDKISKDDPAIFQSVVSTLQDASIDHEVIKYGEYTPPEYLEKLKDSRGMIYLSKSESQGLALFEAWSCGVPTLVYDRMLWTYKNYRYDGESVMPYSNPLNGSKFQKIEEFARSLDDFCECLDENRFDPRAFVLANYTLKKAASSYLELFDQI